MLKQRRALVIARQSYDLVSGTTCLTHRTEQRMPEQREPLPPAKMADRVGELRIPSSAYQEPAAAPEQVARREEPTVTGRHVEPSPQGAVSEASVASPADPAVAPPPPAPAVRHLDPEEIEILIRRGEALLSQGDIASARLMLRRAADAGSARAALTLGGTFDQKVLRKMGVLGFQADPTQARDWYTKAAALGSGEASRRLAGLGE